MPLLGSVAGKARSSEGGPAVPCAVAARRRAGGTGTCAPSLRLWAISLANSLPAVWGIAQHQTKWLPPHAEQQTAFMRRALSMLHILLALLAAHAAHSVLAADLPRGSWLNP